jgi:L-lysine 2,3-aminomutase
MNRLSSSPLFYSRSRQAEEEGNVLDVNTQHKQTVPTEVGTKTPLRKQSSGRWQAELSASITDPAHLLAYLSLSSKLLPSLKRGAHQFPLRVTHSFLSRIKKGDPHDPLLQQILPLATETNVLPGFTQDPLVESEVSPIAGLLHKYQGRVLLIVTGGCAIHCRYCFRRHFPYQTHQLGRKNWHHWLKYIAGDTSIREVILSGGDPLLAQDNYLADLIQKLATISHLKILRIHSRLPIVLPQRITPTLIEALTHSTLKATVIVHCNHANEIDEEVSLGLQALTQANIPIFNQTVLLKNINDKVNTLIDLSYTLFSVNVIPYYLHLLDKVQGAAHFAVKTAAAKTLYWELRKQLPGYLVPTLVQEVPGAPYKLPLL